MKLRYRGIGLSLWQENQQYNINTLCKANCNKIEEEEMIILCSYRIYLYDINDLYKR